MELRDLQRMTVVKLREEALQQGNIIGVHGMGKEQLITALAPIFGIDLEAALRAAREKVAASKGTLKQEIRTLKKERDDAVTEHDTVASSKARRGIKKRKRQLRHLARQAKVAAV
jgi:hypothetical protein